jgi:hypothetical protein
MHIQDLKLLHPQKKVPYQIFHADKMTQVDLNSIIAVMAMGAEDFEDQ